MGQKGSRLQFFTVIIGLITAIIMLLHAVTSIDACSIIKNIFKDKKSETTEKSDKGWDPLNKSLKTLKLEIRDPGKGAVVTVQQITVKGTIEGRVPHDYRLFVLLKDKTGYFLQYPAVNIDESQNQWWQNNVRFGSDGEWQIAVCLANKNATSYFVKLVRENNRTDFKKLPKGAKIRTQIKVTKK